MSKYCSGCGILLQSENEQELGYTNDLKGDYCKRCFRLIHYRDFQGAFVTKDNEEMINHINSKDGFVYFLVDFLNLHEEAIMYYQKIKLPKCFVISKSDTIPRSVSFTSLKKWIRDIYGIKETILFTSQKNVHKLLTHMEKNTFTNLFFAGSTNASKSTILNKITNHLLTTSEMPNTTVDFIPLKWNDKTLYDTVGLTYKNVRNDLAFYQMCDVKKEICPKVYNLKKGTILKLDKDIYFSCSMQNGIAWFGSENISLEKVYSGVDFQKAFEIHVENYSNVYLKGMGFFYIKKACFITFIGVPKDCVSVSPSFIGGYRYE